MREYHIRTSPVEFLAILELKMEKEINRHGRLDITGYIEDGQEEEYLRLLSGEVWEKVEGISGSGEPEMLFWGIVTGFCIETVNDQKKMKLEITTGSCLSDREEHLRTYQDKNKTYEEIFRERAGEYSGGGVIFTRPLKRAAEKLLLQYRETDWEFLKRLASWEQSCIVPEFKIAGMKIFCGLPKGTEFPFPEHGKYTVGKDLGEYYAKKKSGMTTVSEEDCLEYTAVFRENYRIGDYTVVKGRKFVVYKVLSSYENGELLHRCFLRRERGIRMPVIYKEEIAGISLDAVVNEVKEDRVQVTVLEDENRGQDINIWYPYATVYSTPDGTGWYCMPEPGDMVRLTVPGREEGEAYVSSSVHEATESADRKEPSHKVLKSRHQKEVRFTPDSIVITNNQGSRIEMTDGEGIHIVSAHSVLLEAAGNITVSSDTGSLILAGTSAVNLQQRGTSIQLGEGISFIGGELKVQ